MARATKGGQTGKNGEWYEGGQFLPSTELQKMGARVKVARVRKVQIEKFTWVESDRTPILSLVGTVANYEDRYDRSNLRIVPCGQGVAYYDAEFKGKTVQEWCDLYNAGERWMD